MKLSMHYNNVFVDCSCAPREMKAFEGKEKINEEKVIRPRAALDIKFRGNVLTKLSRSLVRCLLVNVRWIDLGDGCERERQREWEMKGTEVARGLRAPRDRAFNYCTARTNLRASGHRCRTPENQFRGRHIQSTRAEGRTKWGRVLFRKLGSESTWQKIFPSFYSEVNTNINHAIYAIYESRIMIVKIKVLIHDTYSYTVNNYSCIICKFCILFMKW